MGNRLRHASTHRAWAVLTFLFLAPAAHAQVRAEQLPGALTAAPQQQRALPLKPQISLPVGHNCTAQEIIGLWKLAALAEVPQTTISSNFAGKPHQYIGINAQSMVYRYEGVNDIDNLTVLMQTMGNAASPVEQYVLANGAMYFYKNRVATESLSCLIADSPISPYLRGDLVLFNLNQATSLVKIYRRVNTGAQATQQNPQQFRRQNRNPRANRQAAQQRRLEQLQRRRMMQQP